MLCRIWSESCAKIHSSRYVGKSKQHGKACAVPSGIRTELIGKTYWFLLSIPMDTYGCTVFATRIRCGKQASCHMKLFGSLKRVDFLPHWNVNGDRHRQLHSRGWPTLSSWQRSKRSKKKQLSGGPSLCVFDIHRMDSELFRCFTCSCLEKPVRMWGAWQSLNMNWCFKESCKEGKEGCQEGAEGTFVCSAWQHSQSKSSPVFFFHVTTSVSGSKAWFPNLRPGFPHVASFGFGSIDRLWRKHPRQLKTLTSDGWVMKCRVATLAQAKKKKSSSSDSSEAPEPPVGAWESDIEWPSSWIGQCWFPSSSATKNGSSII